MKLCLLLTLLTCSSLDAISARVKLPQPAPVVIRPDSIRKFDEWGSLPAHDEMARLDNLAGYHRSETNLNLVLIVYGGRHTYPNEVAGRIALIHDYLNSVGRIPSGNLVLINGGYQDRAWLECWFMPKSIEPPQPYPTVAGRDLIYDLAPPDTSEWNRTFSEAKRRK